MNLLFADTEVEHDVKAAIFSKAADRGIENIPYVKRWFLGHNVKTRKLMLLTKETKQNKNKTNNNNKKTKERSSLILKNNFKNICCSTTH